MLVLPQTIANVLIYFYISVIYLDYLAIYFNVSTMILLAGTLTVSIFFYNLASLKGAGDTTLGCLKSLKSSAFFEVRIRPLTVLG